MMIAVLPDIIQVIVFASSSDALLGKSELGCLPQGGRTPESGRSVPERECDSPEE